jgi:hypothetical protein
LVAVTWPVSVLDESDGLKGDGCPWQADEPTSATTMKKRRLNIDRRKE